MREERNKNNPRKNNNKKKKKQSQPPSAVNQPAGAVFYQGPALVQEVNIFRNHASKAKPVSSLSYSPEKINSELRDFYANKLVIRRLFYPDIPIPIAKYYINLSIVPGVDYQTRVDAFAKTTNEKNDEEIYEHSTNIYGQVPILIPAQHIIPPNIRLNIPLLPFYGVNTSVELYPEVKVLILGTAGVGKSTLSEYYAHLWASQIISPQQKGGLINYEWVFRIPLRNITEERYPSDKAHVPFDVIEKECLAPVFGKENSFLDVSDREKLEATLHDALRKKKVLIILDGFDEFPENSPKHLCEIVKKFLSVIPVIVTSRPYNIYALRNDYKFEESQRFEITGFTPKEMRNYIDNFFANLRAPKNDESQKLFDFLSKNQSIAGACRIPINLELLCSAWEKQPSTIQEVSTISSLYSFVTLSLCQRYLEKQGEEVRNDDDFAVLEKCESSLGFLEHLGFKSASDRRPFFKLSSSREYIQDLGNEEKSGAIIANQKSFGFIRPNNPSGEYDGSSHYYFNHLTFRDFFAARYITYCLQASTQSQASRISYFKHEWKNPDNLPLSLEHFIRQHCFGSQYEFVWWSMAGLLSNADDTWTLKYFFAVLFGQTDQIEISRVSLLIRCLDEANNLAGKLPHGIILYLCQWIDAALTEDLSNFPLYSTIWERLKLSRSIFLHDEVQNVFYTKLENQNDNVLIAVLNALDAIKQLLPDEMKRRLFHRIFNQIYPLDVRNKITSKLASLCDQGLLPVEDFIDIFENKNNELNPGSLSIAIEVLCFAQCFEKKEKFLNRAGVLFFSEDTPSSVRTACAAIFGLNRAQASFFLEAREKHKNLLGVKLEEVFVDQIAPIDYFLKFAVNKETPIELCLEMLEFSLEALVASGKILNPQFQGIFLEKLISIAEDSKHMLDKRFFAFYLLGKFNSHNLGSFKKRFFNLLDNFLSSLLKNPSFGEETTRFVKWISILYINLGRFFQIQGKEFVEKRTVLFRCHFSSIASPDIKRCIALYLSLNDRSLSDADLVEKLNIIVSSSYSREEYLLLTAFNPPGSPDLIFTKAFCHRDCTPFLGKIDLNQGTNIFSLHHVLAKTPSRSILNLCAQNSIENITETQFKCLIEVLVFRFMESGKALYFDEDGLRYFENHKYQLLPLFEEQKLKFAEAFDAALQKITKLKKPRLSSHVISNLWKFPDVVGKDPQALKVGLAKDLDENFTESLTVNTNVLSKRQDISREEKSKMKEQSKVVDLSEMQAVVKKLTTLAKKYNKNSDKTPDACLKAMECYGLAVAVLRSFKLPSGSNEGKEVEATRELREECEALSTKLNEGMLTTLRDNFIHNGIGVSNNLNIAHLLARLKQYQDRLRLIRNPRKFKEYENDIFEYQIKVSEALRDLFKDLIIFCQDILGFDAKEQNIGMTIVMLGSLATQQAFPYSDVEYIILLSDDRAKDNRVRYEALAKLIEIVVISFGETPPVYSDELCNNPEYKVYQRFITKGFRIDEAKKPTAVDWRLSLVNTVDGYTSLESLRTFRPGNHLAAALLLPDYLLGDKKLFDEYREKLWIRIKTGSEHFEFLKKLVEFNLQEQQHLLTRFESASLEIGDDLSIGEQEIDLKELSLYGLNLAVELMLMLHTQGKLKDATPERSALKVMTCLKGHISEEEHAIWLGFIREMMEKRKMAIMSSPGHTAKVKLNSLNLQKMLKQLSQIKDCANTLKASLVENYVKGLSSESALTQARLLEQFSVMAATASSDNFRSATGKQQEDTRLKK